MYRYLVAPVRVTLASSAQFLLESIKREKWAQDSLPRRLGAGERETAHVAAATPYAGLERDWTKL